MTLKLRIVFILAAGTVLAANPAFAAQTQAATAGTADARLKALYDSYASWDAAESGMTVDSRGDFKPTGHLPHVDAAAQLRHAAHLQQLLDQLNAIPQAQLSDDEKVNAAIFRTVLENHISDVGFRTWEMPFNSDSSFWTYLDEGQS